MQESQSYKYVNLLEIISNINRIVRKNNGIDDTLLEIVEAIHTYNTLSTPISLRIVLNNKEYLSKEYNYDSLCLESNFITSAGNKGKIQMR